MALPHEICLAPPVSAMNAFIAPHRHWMESVLGCPMPESLAFEVEVPFGQLVAEDILKGVVLDRQCLLGADPVRAEVLRWELPPELSPRIDLIYSHEQHSPITAKRWAWDPHWRETPVALWFRSLKHALVSTSIPYVSFADGVRHSWQDRLIVNRSEVAAALNLLGTLLADGPRRVRMIGGRDVPLPAEACTWDSVVLDPRVTRLVKDDFTFFLQREAWFRKVGLPFRRGYLLYGPPGNGKTSVVRILASHPGIRAFSLDFSNEELGNDALTELFEAASHWAPSLIIFEDLDRLYGSEDEGQNRTRITLQHLLNCLDGLGSKDGTIVVATANHPERLDPAILRRPGRFDRVVPFEPPTGELRRVYLSKLASGLLDPEGIAAAAQQSDGLSFAQIREAYILAGQFAFQRGDERIHSEDLLEGTAAVRDGATGVSGRLGARAAGFTSPTSASVASSIVACPDPPTGKSRQPEPGEKR
jgi:ATPase family associated with various cellular activities (AAA)